MDLHEAENRVQEMNLKLDHDGLVPAIIRDNTSGEVLMLAYMSPESLAISLAEGRTCFWSRSRKILWRKGETSGHKQVISSIAVDCDRDAVLVSVNQVGAACHNGSRSCFAETIELLTHETENNDRPNKEVQK